VSKQLTINIRSGPQLSSKIDNLRVPNPGDIMIAMIFGWALVCFLLITMGDRVLRRVAQLAQSKEIKESLLSGGDVLGIALIAGSLIVVIMVVLYHKYPRLFVLSLLFGSSFAQSEHVFPHDIGFILKYLALAYIGVYAVLSLGLNFWRIVGVPYVRIALLFTLWTLGVGLTVGGQLDDIWYTGTFFSMFIGFGIFYLYEFNNSFGMEDFLKLLSWGAIIVLLTNWTAIFTIAEYINNGRFQGYHERATGFGVSITPIILILVWRAMADKDPQLRWLFLLMSIMGIALLLWSGSRSPIAATLVGIGILWLRFRSPVFLAGMFIAVLGVAAQFIFEFGGVETKDIATRLGDTESDRFELWADYLEFALASPIYGYSASGLGFALVGDLGGFLQQTLGATNVKYETPHNAYLALVMRFGFVGLMIFLVILIAAMRRAKQVLDMPEIPADKKDLIILPLALIIAISLTQIFEDAVPGIGKGTAMDALLYPSLVICHIYGTSLINYYKPKNSAQSVIKTLPGFHVVAQSQDVN